jgi:hypothetical protein
MTTDFLRRPGLLLAAVLVIVAAGYFSWATSDHMGLVTGDGPDYLIMAKSYAHPGQDRVIAEAAATSRFPPLYPLVLARTGGADDLTRAHLVTIAFFPLALLALLAWHRNEQLAFGVSLLTVLSVAAVPDIWLSALSIQTEYPYLVFSLAAIALLAAFKTRPNDNLLYAATVAIVLAILTRTIGIVLLAALLPALWRVRWRQRGLTLAIVLLPLATWYGLHHPQNGGYVSVFGSFFGGSPLAAIARVLVDQFGALRAGLSSALLLDPDYLTPLADVVAVLGVVAAIARVLRAEPDGLYACAYLGLLMLYPFPEGAHRLVWPILPVLFTQVALVARTLFARATPRAPLFAAAACAAPVLAMAVPSLEHAHLRHADAEVAGEPAMLADPTWYGHDRRESMLYAAGAQGLREALRRAGTLVPADDCVIANRADWVNFYADRRSVSPLPPRVSDADFDAAVTASGCHFVFATPFFDRLYHERMYPLRRFEGKADIVDRIRVPDRFAYGMELEFVLARIAQ